MALDPFASFAEWQHAFRHRSHEWEQRLLQLHHPERQSIRIRSVEENNLLTRRIQACRSVVLKPAWVVVLEDVILEDRLGQIVLPFMPEYSSLLEAVESTIEAPCNRALSPWASHGHFLHDQVSLRGCMRDIL
jgi:hypothetical protein